MDLRIQQRLEQNIQVRKVLEPLVLGQALELGLLAECAHAVRDAALRYLHREVVTRALAAAPVGAAEHRHHLDNIIMYVWSTISH